MSPSDSPAGPAPRLSVVMATYNRLPLHHRGCSSSSPARRCRPRTTKSWWWTTAPRSPCRARSRRCPELPYTLRVETQKNAGAAAARHRGVLAARGDVVIITDDDMQVASDFLSGTWSTTRRARATWCWAASIRIRQSRDMPLFERWYAYLTTGWPTSWLHARRRRGGTSTRATCPSAARTTWRVGGFDET